MKKYFLGLILICFLNCGKNEKINALEITMTKVFLDINNYDHAGPPPRIYLEIEVINNTSGEIILDSSDKYSDKLDSRMIMFNPISNQIIFLGGFSSIILQQKETRAIEIEVDLNAEEDNYFGISKEFFEDRDFDFSKDVDFLLSRIRETFEHSVTVTYLNSKDLNHLNPTNQANEYLKEDRIIQVKWAKNLQYELYEEKPPLPVVNNINL
ncbi:hypothetical protein [Myroides odoratus]|uniref:hypothetical protein n=1 Tax=Myroides odoratus TaxID=256 RepID=UPI0039B0B9DD